MVPDQLTLTPQEFFGLLSGIAALACLCFQRQLHERRPEALHLILDGWPDVVGLDHGAQPPGRGDGLQAGHAGPQHEHPRWRDRPGRRDQ